MHTESSIQDIYAAVLRYAALPVLAFVIFLCWIITNRLMSPQWQQARRNKQIRKAVAARQARLAKTTTASENTASDDTKPSPH